MSGNSLLFQGNLGKRLEGLFGEAGWVLVGQIIVALAALASVRLLTELLPAAQYGQFVLLMGLITLSFGLACRNVMQAGMRFRAEYSTPAETVLLRHVTTRIRNWAMLAAIFLMAIGGFFFSENWGLPVWIGLLMGFVFVSDVLRTYETSLLNAARRQKIMSIWSATEAVARPVAAVAILLTLGGGAPAVLLAYGAATLTISLIFGRLVSLEGKQDQDGPKAVADKQTDAENKLAAGKLFRRIILFILPLLPIPILNWIQSMGDRYLIAGAMGLTEAGLYAATYGLVSQPFLVANSFLDTWLRPRLFEAISKGRKESRQRVFQLWLLLALAIGGFGVFLFHLLHEWVVSLLLAENFRSISNLMVWIALGFAFQLVLGPFLRLCFAYEKTNYVLIVRIVTAIATLGLAVPLIMQFGLAGAAWAVPGYFGVQMLAAMIAGTRARKLGDKMGYGQAAA